MQIHFQPGDKSVAGVCEPGFADDEMVSMPFYRDKRYPGYRFEHVPGKVRTGGVVVGGVEIMEL